MDQPKRKYKRHKINKKVGIRFYLNEKLKPRIINNEMYYPLYIQLTINSQTKHFKSLTDLYLPINNYELALEENRKLIEEEERIVRKTAEISLTDNFEAREELEAIDITNKVLIKGALSRTESQMQQYHNLDDFVEESLKKVLILALVMAAEIPAKKSYLVNLINWENNSASFLYEYLPTALKDINPAFVEAIEQGSFLALNFRRNLFDSIFPLGVRRCDWKDGYFAKRWRENYIGPDRELIETLITDVQTLINEFDK